MIGPVHLNCCEYSFAVPIGSCCNVSLNNLENQDDYENFGTLNLGIML